MDQERSLRRVKVAVMIVAAAAGVGLAGWAGSAALRPGDGAASAGRVLALRYEVRREPTYVPPPVAEETRLATLAPTSATTVDEGVLSAQAMSALRSLQAAEDARAAAARSALRLENVRLDGGSAESAAVLGGDAVAPVGATAVTEDERS